MMQEQIIIQESPQLRGALLVDGAKNAVLVAIASLVLCPGKSTLKNVPASDDVYHMIELLRDLGAQVFFDDEKNTLHADTTHVQPLPLRAEIFKKIRASVLLLGPLLVRFGKARVCMPGGDRIGARPIDFHLKAFKRMGADITFVDGDIVVTATKLVAQKIVLEYPSVGATENILMAAALTQGMTVIVNAAIEPEVTELITMLNKMGAQISIATPMTIIIEGKKQLDPIEYEIMPDRLEVGTLLLAAAITHGEITITNGCPDKLEVFLAKLDEMGHTVSIDNQHIHFKATTNPRAVSFITMPYPGFPTDLQPMMMAALTCADGESVVTETVYDNRFLHVEHLNKMGADIKIQGHRAYIKGVDELYGTSVIATDIRASASLVLAGLKARGETMISGVYHLKRGYQNIEEKLKKLGAKIGCKS